MTGARTPTAQQRNAERNDMCKFGTWLYTERFGNRRACNYGCGVHEVRRNECIGCGNYSRLIGDAR